MYKIDFQKLKQYGNFEDFAPRFQLSLLAKAITVLINQFYLENNQGYTHNVVYFSSSKHVGILKQPNHLSYRLLIHNLGPLRINFSRYVKIQVPNIQSKLKIHDKRRQSTFGLYK